jgi:hypothetical protein
MKKQFRSRISVLLIGFILLVFLLPVFADGARWLYGLGALILIVALFLFGTIYTISKDKLYVKLLWFVPLRKVNIPDIYSIERTYNPLSSPASSLRRLSIRFDKYSVISGHGIWLHLLISPVRELEFVEELKRINPAIHVNIPDNKSAWRIWDWDI